MQKFNYHSHTYRCGHATPDMTDEEYIQEYIKMGFKKVAFTDHCPEKIVIDKRPRIRMEYNQKNEYISNIKALKEKYKDKIQIESGYEVEYLPGEEENIKELKEESDKIILGQHFIYGDEKQLKILRVDEYTDEDLITYAKYIEKAIELGIPDIIAHPDIYMMSRKSFGEIESKIAYMICEAAEKYDIPLEINLAKVFSRTYRQNRKLPIEEQKKKIGDAPYPCKEFWKIVAKHNVKVVYGIDVHFRGQILLWNELLELAKEKIGEETIKKLKFIEE